jgi:hypothetical protein
MTTTTNFLAVNTSREAVQERNQELIQRNETQSREASFSRISRIGKNISIIAFPAIAMVALASIPVVEANRFNDCIENCDRTADGGLPRMICYTLCAALDIFTKH